MTSDLKELTLATSLSPQVRCTSPWGRMCLRAAAWALEATVGVLPRVTWGCATVPTCGGPRMGPTPGTTGAQAPWGDRGVLPCLVEVIPQPQRRRTPSFLRSHTSMCEFTLVSSALNTTQRAIVLSLACHRDSLYYQQISRIPYPSLWRTLVYFNYNVLESTRAFRQEHESPVLWKLTGCDHSIWKPYWRYIPFEERLNKILKKLMLRKKKKTAAYFHHTHEKYVC